MPSLNVPPVSDAQRATLADELEQRGSPLCDCAGLDAAPVSRRTGEALAHHCDCAAVRASALVRRAATTTRHAAQCGCEEADRSAALFWEGEFTARRPGARAPGSGAC